MNVIKLNRTDISEMVKRAVNSLLSESVREEMGSIAADKEDVINEIVEYIANEWERIRMEGKEPVDKDSYTFNDDPSKGGEIWTYPLIVPEEITEKLGIAEKFQLNVAIRNFTVGQDRLSYFGNSERGVEGTSYGGEDYSEFKKAKMKVTLGRIDLYVPAINGELQVKGLYSTLYHELNHNLSQLMVKIKNSDGKTDSEISKINLMTQSKRASSNPHFTVQRELRPDPLRGFLQSMSYGKYMEEFRAINFILYGLWERTERNARAEAIYGELSAFKTTRDTFKEDYKKTELCFQIAQFKELLEKVKAVPLGENLWEYAARLINMKPRGEKESMSDDFHAVVRDRFVARTEQLIDILYRKGMKVAELYLQKHGPQKEPTRLERYKQEHNK